MRVLTYNIRYANPGDGDDIWDNRRDRVIEVIRQADLVGLQEVTPEQFQDVRAGTPGMTWYGVGRDDGQEAGEHAPVGFRTDRFELLDKGSFWLSPTPEKAGSMGWDAALPRLASWVKLTDRQSGQPLLVVSTHFDHRGAEARRESAALIREQLKKLAGDTQRVILVGDLNARPDSPPLNTLLGSGAGLELTDSRTVSQTPPTGPSGTFNGFREIRPEMQIDYVTFAGPLQVLSHQTLDPKTSAGRFASDHLPILVRLQ
ncbi:endonuclease/exonuclease/phosphatase family protein [Roseiconus nitratireducens]|uniref:Endonuclease/exonuclease/phosphatase family protein n=2 Tax=Roseiconus nitratireducens TaxID=2605748 RepID=A0A5M6CWK1_9BACT|nr:endonuclease/exonuclease/phosphatase family protein [Roseiconus nitratireducens]